MTSEKQATEECPYCKEEVHPKAVKCKHCQSRLKGGREDHGGTCPRCKEKIHPEAVKCKHCLSILSTQGESPCGCSSADMPAGSELPNAMQRLAAPGGIGGGGNNPELCDWNCMWDWVDCLDSPLGPGAPGSPRRLHACNIRLMVCRLFCGVGGTNLGGFGSIIR